MQQILKRLAPITSRNSPGVRFSFSVAIWKAGTWAEPHAMPMNILAQSGATEQERRHGRFAAELERMISPEGAYPVIGRSINYRFGSFHAPSDAALLHLLPENVSPAQVLCALTAVIKRQLGMPHTFNQDGWLRSGYAGSQIRMAETYINTGSLYLCTAAFLPLGLPETDPFWASPYREWTAKKAWNGVDVGADHHISRVVTPKK